MPRIPNKPTSAAAGGIHALQRRYLAWAVLVFLLVWIIHLIGGHSDAFKHCVELQKNARDYNALRGPHSVFAGASLRADLTLECSGAWLDPNHEIVNTFATVSIALFTFTLWWSTRKLWQSAESQRSADEANRRSDVLRLDNSIEIAREQSQSIGLQARLLNVQTELLEKQKEIGRQSFLASHRPRIYVRNVVIRNPKPMFPATTDDFFQVGENVSGQLYAANHGAGDGWVTETLVKVRWFNTPSLPMERPYEGQNGEKREPPVLVLGGSSLPVLFQSTRPMQNVAPLILRGMEGWKLYVMGWVEYRDGSYEITTDRQRTRRTAFCRVFDPASQRFVRVNDDDYEHEE